MHELKVLSGMVGLLVLIAGAFQGLALGGILSADLYNNPPFLSGIIGGLIPVVSGVLGTVLIAWGMIPPKHEL